MICMGLFFEWSLNYFHKSPSMTSYDAHVFCMEVNPGIFQLHEDQTFWYL